MFQGGQRQGKRTDLASDEQESLLEEPVEILPQVDQPESGQKTREIAAQKAGFGSDKTYRDAKTVVEKADPALVAAMAFIF